MKAQFEGLIDTAAGPAFVRIIGDGPTCLAFHGGPGFEHGSMIDGLGELTSRRRVIFFDQLGCGRTPPPDGPVTAEATFDHAAALLDALAAIDTEAAHPLGLVAYSWGAVVAAAAFSRRPDARVGESLLICPTPVHAAGYAAARAAISARIPGEAMQRMVTKIQSGASGGEAFAEVQPYYAASPDTALPQIEVSTAVYMSVDATLGETFDFRAALDRFGAMSVISGSDDFPPPEAVAPFLDRATNHSVIAGAAHYPFAEQPQAFAAAVRQALDRAC